MDDEVTNEGGEVPASPALDALEAQAQALEGAAAPTANVPQVAASDPAAELFSALQLVRMMAAPMMRWWADYLTVWSDDALRGIAQAGAQVMERHGWTMGEAWNRFGPYVALIGAALPPSLLTWQAIKLRQLEVAAHERAQQTQG